MRSSRQWALGGAATVSLVAAGIGCTTINRAPQDTLRVPPQNEQASDPNTIVLDVDGGALIAVDNSPVTFSNIPDSVKIWCADAGSWEEPPVSPGGRRACQKTPWVQLYVASDASTFASGAMMCADCRDDQRPVVLQPTTHPPPKGPTDPIVLQCNSQATTVPVNNGVIPTFESLPAPSYVDVQCSPAGGGAAVPAQTTANGLQCPGAATSVSFSVKECRSLPAAAAMCIGCQPAGGTSYKRAIVVEVPDAGASDAGDSPPPHITRCSEDPDCMDPPLAAHGPSFGIGMEVGSMTVNPNKSGSGEGNGSNAAWVPRLDLGWRFSDRFYLGAYIAWGTGQAPLTTYNLAGATAEITWLKMRWTRNLAFLPYVGGTLGGAIAPASRSDYPTSAIAGFQAGLQLGFPVGINEIWSIGPYFDLTRAWLDTLEYGGQSFSLPGTQAWLVAGGIGASATLPFKGDWP